MIFLLQYLLPMSDAASVFVCVEANIPLSLRCMTVASRGENKENQDCAFRDAAIVLASALSLVSFLSRDKLPL